MSQLEISLDSSIPPLDLTDSLQPQARKKVELYFISSEKEAKSCSFWVGVYRKGPLKPEQLMNLKKTNEILTSAVNEGVDCHDPLVLADTSSENGSIAYFLAPIQNEKLAESHLWLEKLCEAIFQWGPTAPGIYFAPEILGSDLATKFMSRVLRTLLEKKKFQNFYLLVGSHGIHPILNTVLKLKSKLEEESQIDLLIFH